MRVVGQIFHQLRQQLLCLQKLALIHAHLGQHQHQLGAPGVEVKCALQQGCGFIQPAQLAQRSAQAVHAVKIMRVTAQCLLQHCSAFREAPVAQVQACQLARGRRVGRVRLQQSQQLSFCFHMVAVQLRNFCRALNGQLRICGWVLHAVCLHTAVQLRQLLSLKGGGILRCNALRECGALRCALAVAGIRAQDGSAN